MNICGYSIGGPVIIPKRDRQPHEREEGLLLRCRRSSPTTCGRRTSPARTCRRRSSARATSRRRASRNGEHSADHRSDTDVRTRTAAVPGQRRSRRTVSTRWASAMLNLLPLPNGVLDQTAGQQCNLERRARHDAAAHAQELRHRASTRSVEPEHRVSASGRCSTATTARRSTASRRASARSTTCSRATCSPAPTRRCISPTMVNEVDRSASRRTTGASASAPGDSNHTATTRDYYRSERRHRSAAARRRTARPAIRTSARVQKDSIRICPTCSFSGGDRPSLAQYRPTGGNGPLPRRNENIRYTFQDDLSWTKGRHNFKFGALRRARQQDRAGLERLHRRLQLRSQRRQPAQHRQRLRQRAARRVHELQRARQPRRRGGPALAVGRVRAGQLARQPAVDAGLRHPRDAPRRRLRDPRHELGVRPGSVEVQRRRPGSTSRSAGRTACRAPRPAPRRTARRETRSPARSCPSRSSEPSCPVPADIANGQFVGGLAGQEERLVLRHAGPLVGAALRHRLGRHRRPEDRHPRLGRDLLQLHQPQPVSLQRRPARLAACEASSTRRSTNWTTSPAQGTSSRARSRSTCPAGFAIPLHGEQLPQGKLQPEKNYQGNVAFQRDIGFKTVAEVAWVGNFGRHFWRAKTTNNIEPYAYGKAGKPVPQRADQRQLPAPRLPGYRCGPLPDDRRRHPELQRDAGQRQSPARSRIADGPRLHAVEGRGHPGMGLPDRGAVRRAGHPRSVLRSALGVAEPGSPSYPGAPLQLRASRTRPRTSRC